MEKKGVGIQIVGGVFHGIEGKPHQPYPAWRYHQYYEPKIVNNTDEDYTASLAGWKDPHASIAAVPHLANWNHDLEDMNPDQLRLFALDEYGVELPKEANEEQLIKAIWQLARATPDKGRMVLLAQSVELEYDEICKQLLRDAETMEMKFSHEFEA